MAFLVRDWDDLQLAYLLLKDCPKNSQKLVDLKRLIREYNRDVNEETCVKIIKDYGIDGYISLEMLPEDIDNEADAICYFENRRTYTCPPSMYDCTGALMTNWFKVFKRNGRYWAYHSVSCDV